MAKQLVKKKCTIDIRAANEESSFNLLHLPAKCDIIRYLNVYDRLRLQMVSKEWYDIIKESWSSVRYFHFRNLPNDPRKSRFKLEKILELCGKYITSIEIKKASFENLFVVNKYCHALRSVKLTAELCTYDEFLPWEREFCTLLKNNKKLDTLVLSLANVSKQIYLSISNLEFLKSLYLIINHPIYANITDYFDSLANLTDLKYFRLCARFFNPEEFLTSSISKLQNITHFCIVGSHFENASLEYFENLLSRNNQGLEFFVVRLHRRIRNVFRGNKPESMIVNEVYHWKKNRKIELSKYYEY